MTRQEIENMIIKCRDEAVHQYKQGDIKKGKKAEQNMKYFKELLKTY